MKRLLYFIAAFTAGGILLLLGFHVAPGTSSAAHKQQHAYITATTQKAPVILVPEPSDKEKVALLRAEAHKRGIRWSVRCNDGWSDEADKAFIGFANDKKEAADAGQYIEEGALPWWYAYGSTQTDAAYNLYISIQQDPVMPKHRTIEKKKPKTYCPPEIRGQ